MKGKMLVVRLNDLVTAKDKDELLKDIEYSIRRLQKEKKLVRITRFHPPIKFEVQEDENEQQPKKQRGRPAGKGKKKRRKK